MAAGGPILTAGVHGFAIVPISCHSPIRTPLVVSEDDVIELLLANDRDALLVKALTKIHEERRHETIDVAVVYGADHILPVVTYLMKAMKYVVTVTAQSSGAIATSYALVVAKLPKKHRPDGWDAV